MGVFNILKKKEKVKLDLPPPPPIPKPIAKEKPRLILSKKIPEVPKFKPTIPRFEPKKFEFKSIPKPIFKPSIKEKIIPKFNIPKFRPSPIPRPSEIKQPKLEKSYIKAENFRDIIGHINEIKKKINESEEVLTKLNEIKNKEDKEFGKWHSKFEDIQRKLTYVDRFLGG